MLPYGFFITVDVVKMNYSGFAEYRMAWVRLRADGLAQRLAQCPDGLSVVRFRRHRGGVQ